KDHFHIQQQEHQRINVVLRAKLNPRIPNSLNTALVGLLLDGVGPLGSEKFREENRRRGKQPGERQEQPDEYPFIYRHESYILQQGLDGQRLTTIGFMHSRLATAKTSGPSAAPRSTFANGSQLTAWDNR